MGKKINPGYFFLDLVIVLYSWHLPWQFHVDVFVICVSENLETAFKNIENSLTYLEEIVQIQNLQETQLERRFKLAMHKENKLKQLENLRGNIGSSKLK